MESSRGMGLLYILFCLESAHAIVNLYNIGLETIPWNVIPANETNVKLANNEISEIEWAPSGLSLSVMNLGVNKIKIFPNLNNLSSTLTELQLNTNPLVSIPPDRLAALTMLKILGLKLTKLTNLPDTTNFPVKLEFLNLRLVDLANFPNPARLPRDDPVKPLAVKLQGDEYHCGPNMFWVMLGYQRGLLTTNSNGEVFTKPVCSTPEELATFSLDNLNVQNFFNPVSQVSASAFVKMARPHEFLLYPNITGFFHETMRLNCGFRCLQLPACVMFAYEQPLCVIAEYMEGTVGTRQEFVKHTEWFVRRAFYTF